MALGNPITRRRLVKGVAAGGAVGLAGCSGDGGNGNGNGNGGEEGIELTNWSWGPNVVPLEEAKAAWEEENPYTVNIEEISSDAEVWTSALQVQEGLPGIGLLLYPTYRAAARNGGLENLDDIILPNLDQFIDSAIGVSHVEGSFYGFPHSINPTSMIYNKSMFEDAGLPGNPEDLFDEIQTYDDLVQAGEQMQSEIDADILLAGSENIRIPRALRTQFDGGFYNSDGEFEFDQQANVDAFQTLKDLQPYSLNLSPGGENHWEEFRQENVASFIAPGWYIGSIRSQLSDMSGEFRILQLPAPEQGGPRGSTQGGAPEAIPAAKDSETKEVAKEFGQFRHMSEESYNMKLRNFIFASNSVEDPEVYEEEVEFFGGQTIFDMLGPTLEISPAQQSPPNPEIRSMFFEVNRLIMAEDGDIEETLSDFDEQMRETLTDGQETRMTLEEVKAQA
jgi:ABC-type glycerol-3-phosphate transport system substrate-binding protein